MVTGILMDRKLFIFANEKRTDKNTLDMLVQIPNAHLLVTKDFSEIRREIDPSYDALICAGGDGTLNSFLNIAINEGLQDKTFGIIPIGSGNDFSKYALDIESYNPIESIISYARGNDNVKNFDIGYITPKETIYFHNVAGIGFDAKIVEKAPLYKKISKNDCYRIAAGVSLIPYWINSSSRMSIRCDGKDIELNALMAVLNNTTRAGGGIPLNPYGSPTDGIIDLLILEKASITNFAKLFLGISKGNIKVLEDKHIYKFQNATYEVSAKDRKLPLQYDGELHYEHVDGFKAGYAFKMKFICNKDRIII